MRRPTLPPLLPIVRPADDGALRAALDAAPGAVVLELGGRKVARAAAGAVATSLRRVPVRPRLLALVASLDASEIEADLLDAAGWPAEAIVLPSAVGLRDVEHLSVKLAVLEAERGLPDGGIGILAVAADTPEGVLALPDLRRGEGSRLAGLACDPLALARRLGCSPDAPVVTHSEAATILAASAAGVPAVLVRPARGGQVAAPDIAALRGRGWSSVLVRMSDPDSTDPHSTDR